MATKPKPARDRRVRAGHEQLLRLRHARARLGDGAVHVPALDDRRAVAPSSRNVSGATSRPAGVLAAARRCSRCSATWRSPPASADRQSTARPTRSSRCRAVRDQFPRWFAGVAFAAIAIGALVPAAIMSIAAANLFTRNIYRDFIKPDATPQQEAQVSKIVSLLVKFGALSFVLVLDSRTRSTSSCSAGSDPADLPGDRARPVHPLVPPVGAAGRLGGRHGLRHAGRLPPEPRGDASTSAARWRPSPRRAIAVASTFSAPSC